MSGVRVLLVMLFVVSISALGYAGNGGHMGYGDHMMSYGGGIYMWFLFLVVAAIVVYVAVQMAKSKSDDTPVNETATYILKKRYAKGDITKEEFEEKMKHIRG